MAGLISGTIGAKTLNAFHAGLYSGDLNTVAEDLGLEKGVHFIALSGSGVTNGPTGVTAGCLLHVQRNNVEFSGGGAQLFFGGGRCYFRYGTGKENSYTSWNDWSTL